MELEFITSNPFSVIPFSYTFIACLKPQSFTTSKANQLLKLISKRFSCATNLQNSYFLLSLNSTKLIFQLFYECIVCRRALSFVLILLSPHFCHQPIGIYGVGVEIYASLFNEHKLARLTFLKANKQAIKVSKHLKPQKNENQENKKAIY